MTRKERLRRCYFSEKLDRPAVYIRNGFPDNDSTYDHLKTYLDKYTELKFDWSYTNFEENQIIQQKIEPYSEDFERLITILKTPKGNLESSYLRSLKGLPGLHETFLLKEKNDVAKYLSLPLPKLSGNCNSYFQLQDKIGESGIVSTGLGLNPAGFVAELFGSENFAVFSILERELIHELCERQMGIIINRVKYMIKNGIGPFFAMLGEEYIVPPLHGPDDFYEFNVKYDKPIIDIIHDAGGRIHIHSHGSIKKVIQGFIDMGTDVLHPFEGPPMGDITPQEAKAISRNKMCLEGNIQINRFYENSSEEIIAETQELIKNVFDDKNGLIVSATASPFIRGEGEKCFNQFKAMIDVVTNWK
ncbi:MAG: hypothetical protein UT30_C0025G0008 [Candidatus Uhrbacteria bacterium GW2011_GWF2_39_13]|uniref:Uroporphyrinogen decarboxylase (URO-D) domain-containing protein n=1 Tax=Candidatus Uhrbacteria bacterium GW2011_GWF2_39_13 TaxID=1618995 RepID=A0A0G0MT62_9BACT|nr:MAG: hypothetical protein UT30_C0025G0008 [Candidatus Uhrbacteria bacterium GW2011_GWF2_39_13]